MPDHLVQGMVPQLTPEQSLHLVHVVLGRCWGSLLLCGMGTCFILNVSPQYPPPQSRKTSAPCFGCHLQASVLFASVERSEGKLGILRLVSAFCPFIAFLRKECGAQELLPSGRWQRRQISDTVTWPLSACPKPQSPACRK